MMSFKRCLAIALVLCTVLCLCACSDTQKPTDPQNESQKPTNAPVETGAQNPTYTVKVVDENGNPIAGAMVQLCLESCYPNKTDASGIAQYVVAEADYKVSFLKMPDGYTYSSDVQEFHFADDSKDMTITLKKVS